MKENLKHHKPIEKNNKTLLLGLIGLMVVVLTVGSITTIGNDINVARFLNITNNAGLVIGSYVDGVTCSTDWCVYIPWYSPAAVYIKNGSDQRIQNTNTEIGTLLNNIPGGRVQIRAGTYSQSTQLNTGDKVYEIEGEGANETIINAAYGLSPFYFSRTNALANEYAGGYIKDLTINVGGANVHAINVTNSWFFEASGLKISSASNYTSAINLSNSYHASIYDNRIINFNGTGIYLGTNSNGAEVYRNDFSPRGVYASSVEIAGQTTNAKIYNNWFEFAGGYGSTHINLTGAKEAKIYANRISNPSADYNAIAISGSTNSKIFGNSLYCGEGACINVTGGTYGGVATRSNDIQNNDFWLESSNTSHKIYGIYFNEDSSIISGNNFYVAGTVNAPIEVASGQTGININSNNIIATAANSVGIRCNGNCQIVGNWFETLSVGINGGGQSQLINSNWFNGVGTNWTNFGASSRFNGNFPN